MTPLVGAKQKKAIKKLLVLKIVNKIPLPHPIGNEA